MGWHCPVCRPSFWFCMPTYKQLRDRIANEMQRPDLSSGGTSSPIALAVQDAVRHFKDEAFYINKNTTRSMYAWKWIANTEGTESRAPGDGSDPYYAAYLSTTPNSLGPITDNGFAYRPRLNPTLPTDFSQIITLSIAKDNTLYQLTRVSYEEIIAMDSIYATGSNTIENPEGAAVAVKPHLEAPAYWTYMPRDGVTTEYDTDEDTDETTVSVNRVGTPDAIRIYPRPNKDYTLLMAYETSLAAPVNDSDSVFWTNDAYRLIKSFAKGVLYADYLQQFDLAQANETMAQSEYNRLVTTSESRAFSDTVEGHLL